MRGRGKKNAFSTDYIFNGAQNIQKTNKQNTSLHNKKITLAKRKKYSIQCNE